MHCLLLGAGKTTIECMKALIKLKKKVSICLSKEEISKISDYFGVIDEVIYFENFYEIDFKKYDYIVRSPGLSAINEYIKYLKNSNIELINEMELAYILSNKKGYYIGITGSNGKTTTVSLLYECLKKQTNNVLLAGNIGIPLISLIDKINNYTIIILEMSSFQLEDMKTLKLDIACILNLSVNHLDSVPNLDYYYSSKFNIIKAQDGDNYLLIDNEDETINEYLHKFKIKSKLINYTKTNFLLKDIKLKGEHNIKNIKAVITILNILGFDIDYTVIKQFDTLKYHLEELDLNRNYLVINDSKSTTVDSLKKAIDSYKDKNIILIFGGKNKGGDFSFLNDLSITKICFGELSEELKNVSLDYKSYDLESCVNYALEIVKENDVILFSCGCSSFDLFNNYKERAEKFNELISK